MDRASDIPIKEYLQHMGTELPSFVSPADKICALLQSYYGRIALHGITCMEYDMRLCGGTKPADGRPDKLLVVPSLPGFLT